MGISMQGGFAPPPMPGQGPPGQQGQGIKRPMEAEEQNAPQDDTIVKRARTAAEETAMHLVDEAKWLEDHPVR